MLLTLLLFVDKHTIIILFNTMNGEFEVNSATLAQGSGRFTHQERNRSQPVQGSVLAIKSSTSCTQKIYFTGNIMYISPAPHVAIKVLCIPTALHTEGGTLTPACTHEHPSCAYRRAPRHCMSNATVLLAEKSC